MILLVGLAVSIYHFAEVTRPRGKKGAFRGNDEVRGHVKSPPPEGHFAHRPGEALTFLSGAFLQESLSA